MKATLTRCLLVAALCLLGAKTARADEYHTARVSDLKGNLSVRGEDEDDVSYVYRNAVIRSGDTLWTDDASRAELELPRSTWIRLAEDSKVEVRRLTPTPEFRLWNGSLYIDAGTSPHPPRVITPVGDVELEPDSLVRVDLSGDDNARVSVLHGRAQIIPDRGEPVRMRSEERAYLEPNHAPEDPKRFDPQDRDTFDTYQRERVDYFVSRPEPRELEGDFIGARDLADYGGWVEVEHVRYWRPRAAPDWRPYSSGYWSDVPGCGYTWIDYEPWGYTTCHYGRWEYRPAYGWLWAPQPVWGPAYVSWASSGGYYGWAPLDRFDRPCHYGNGSFISVGVVFDNRSWTFCAQDSFFYGRHHQEFLEGRRPFRSGTQINFSVTNVHVVKNVYNEIGVPREHVRGLAVGRDGRPARDRVLAVEKRIPASRQRSIEQRFQVRSDRDVKLAQRPSEVERFQRNQDVKIDRARIATGEEAQKHVARGNGGNGGNSGDRPRAGNDGPNGRNGDRPRAGNDTPSGRGNDRPGDRAGDRGNPDKRPASTDTPGNRDDRFRRGGTGGNGPGDKPGRDTGTPGRGDRPGDKPGRDNGTPGRGTGDRPGDKPGRDTGTPGRGTGDRPGDKPGRDNGTPGRGTGDRPGDKPGRDNGTPGRGTSDRPGDKPTDRSTTPGGRDDRFRRGGDTGGGNNGGGNGGNNGGTRNPADAPKRDGGTTPRDGGTTPRDGGTTPRDRGTSDKPTRDGGSTPSRGTGDRPTRDGGSTPSRGTGDRPARDGGSTPTRGSDRPSRDGGSGSGSKSDTPRGDGTRGNSRGDRGDKSDKTDKSKNPDKTN